MHLPSSSWRPQSDRTVVRGGMPTARGHHSSLAPPRSSSGTSTILRADCILSSDLRLHEERIKAHIERDRMSYKIGTIGCSQPGYTGTMNYAPMLSCNNTRLNRYVSVIPMLLFPSPTPPPVALHLHLHLHLRLRFFNHLIARPSWISGRKPKRASAVPTAVAVEPLPSPRVCVCPTPCHTSRRVRASMKTWTVSGCCTCATYRLATGRSVGSVGARCKE